MEPLAAKRLFAAWGLAQVELCEEVLVSETQKATAWPVGRAIGSPWAMEVLESVAGGGLGEEAPAAGEPRRPGAAVSIGNRGGAVVYVVLRKEGQSRTAVVYKPRG